jgi:hypothetical protein
MREGWREEVASKRLERRRPGEKKTKDGFTFS